MGAGMGAGPPMTPPGLATGGGRGTADYARGNIASERGAFGRSLADQQQARAMERVQTYRQRAEARRAEALAMAAAARAGRPVPVDAARIRQALEEDMKAWRDAFRIGRSEWQEQRQQWLDSRGEMSAAEWALMRERWFALRDEWIARQIGWAQAQRH